MQQLIEQQLTMVFEITAHTKFFYDVQIRFKVGVFRHPEELLHTIITGILNLLPAPLNNQK